jgi:hypothetical protein
MSVRQQIRRLAFARYLMGEGVTLSEATREAARSLAIEHKRRKANRPVSQSSSGGGLRTALLR